MDIDKTQKNFKKKCFSYYEKNPFFSAEQEDINKTLESIFSTKELVFEDYVKSLKLSDKEKAMLIDIKSRLIRQMNDHNGNKVILVTIILLLINSSKTKDEKKKFLKMIFDLADYQLTDLITYFKFIANTITWTLLIFSI